MALWEPPQGINKRSVFFVQLGPESVWYKALGYPLTMFLHLILILRAFYREKKSDIVEYFLWSKCVSCLWELGPKMSL